MASKKKKQVIPQIYINPIVMSVIGEALNDYTTAMNDSEKRKAKDKFMDLYQKAEFAYKELLKEYKIKVDGLTPVSLDSGKLKKNEFNPNNMKILDSQVEKVMVFAKIPMEKKLFSKDEYFKKEGHKSCRILRDEITHSSSKKAIDEVFERKKSLYQVLNTFLNRFSKP